MGALADQLAAITDPAERSRLKVEAMAVLADMNGRSVVRGNFTITLSDGPRLRLVNGTPLLEFGLTIKRTLTGKDVTPADLNPIRVYNPPILVDDPAGDIVRIDPLNNIVRYGNNDYSTTDFTANACPHGNLP